MPFNPDNMGHSNLVHAVISGFRELDMDRAEAGLPTLPLILPDRVWQRLADVCSHQVEPSQGRMYLTWGRDPYGEYARIHIYPAGDGPVPMEAGTRPRDLLDHLV
jgi:hypothetical protein